MKRHSFSIGLWAAFGLWAMVLLGQRISPNNQTVTPVAWTSSTALNAAVSMPTFSYASALVSLNQTSTITQGNVAFEGSDTANTSVTDNWFSVSCAAPTTNGSTYLLTASTKIAFQCNIVGYLRFRVRLSNQIMGTGTVNVGINLASLGAIPPGQANPTGSTTVTNLPTTVDTGNGATSASTPRVTISNDSTGQVKTTNLPTTVDTNQGAAGPSTIRVVPSNNAPLTSIGVGSGGQLTRTYLGFGSANTAKTTGAITVTASTAGHNAIAIGCSGNFATTNWQGAITDGSGANTWIQLGPAAPAALPQANSTTQVCLAYVAVNISSFTTVTFTISGSSSANTTTSVMAWDVGNATPSFTSVDQWAYGTGSSNTALTTAVAYPAQENEVAITGGCASTGTITLPAQSGLTFDSGSQAIASGSNIVTCYGGSALLGNPVGVTGSFTDGSSAAYSQVTVLMRGYSLTSDGLQHLSGTSVNTSGGTNPPQINQWNGAGYSPVVTGAPLGWMVTNNPGSGSTATIAHSAVVGRIPVVTGICYSLVGDSTGAAATQTVTLATGTGYTAFSDNAANLAGVSNTGFHQCFTGLSLAARAGDSWTLAFGGNTAHALEAVTMTGYDLLSLGITY